MGYIADQFLIILVILYLVLRVLLKPDTHFLKILAQLAYLIIRVHIQCEFQVSVANLLRGLLKLVQRTENGTVYPVCQHNARKHQNGDTQYQHLPYHGFYFRYQVIHIGNNKSASFLAVRKGEIHLLNQVLALAVQINAAL